MNRLYVHPVPVRIWHWFNVIAFVLMILSGLHLRYVGSFGFISFDMAVTAHTWIGFFLIGNYSVWLLYYLFSERAQSYHPELNPKKYFRASLEQIYYYCWGIFRGEPSPHHVDPYHKFNPLQQVFYQIIMLFLLPIQFFTGILLWDLAAFGGTVEMLGGVRVVSSVHMLVFIFFAGYLVVHPYLATLGHTPTAHIKAMFSGYEEVETETDHKSAH
jgi:thiosulfate reductase cytochrome b subunit